MNPRALWPLPLAAALLSLTTIHLAYLVSAWHGQVPWCLPWLDSCASISASGRVLPARLFFKPALTVAALGTAASWWLCAAWLRRELDEARALRTVFVAAPLAALLVITYLAALGEIGDTARLLRRVGVSLGFAGNALCALLVLVALGRLRSRAGGPPAWWSERLWRASCTVLAVLFLLGFASVALAAWHPHYDRIEDAFEWCFAVLLNGFLALLAPWWRRAGLGVVLQQARGPH